MPILTNISADVANHSTDINASVILVRIMDFTDVPMLKIWLILVNVDTNINIGASLVHIRKYIRINSLQPKARFLLCIMSCFTQTHAIRNHHFEGSNFDRKCIKTNNKETKQP